MTRIRLLAILGLLIVTPALAQVMQAPQVINQPVATQSPLVTQVVPPPEAVKAIAATESDPITFDITLDPERAKALIRQLTLDKRDLGAKLNDSNGKLTDAISTIDEMTKRGGSLVHAYCESHDMSRSTAGATENCAMSGYACAPVEGTCRRSCTTTDDCAEGTHNCEAGQCVPRNKYATHR